METSGRNLKRMKKKSGILGYKQGNAIVDSIYIVIVLFAIAVITVFLYVSLYEVNEDIQEDEDLSADAKQILDDTTTDYPILFDGLFIFILVGLWILVIIASFSIDAHPIFFGVVFVLLIFVFLAAIIFSNTFVETMAEEDMIAFAIQFPKMQWVMNNLLTVIIVIGFSIMLALYGKNKLG